MHTADVEAAITGSLTILVLLVLLSAGMGLLVVICRRERRKRMECLCLSLNKHPFGGQVVEEIHQPDKPEHSVSESPYKNNMVKKQYTAIIQQASNQNQHIHVCA